MAGGAGLIQSVDDEVGASPWLRPFNGAPIAAVLSDKNVDTIADGEDEVDYAKQVEPPGERRRRYFSLAVITFTAFTFNLSFSIILTSAKPYLDEMDPDAGTQFLGLFLAAQPLAQLFFSPLLGYLGNRIGSIRPLSIASTLVLAAGFVLYACISAMPEPRRWYLFGARFLIGAAAGSVTLCFSYIASATTVKERTTAFSLFSLAGSTAFVLGPVIQSAFAPFGGGTAMPMGYNLYFNLFSGPSWLSAALALLNVAAFMPCIFTEYNVAKKEGDWLTQRALMGKTDRTAMTTPAAKTATSKLHDHQVADSKTRKDPDKYALIICVIIFASVQFNFIFLESLATLLTIEQVGLAETRSIVIVGLAFAAAGVYSGLIFALLGPLARKVGERAILIAGIVFLILGPISLYPYDGPPPPIKYINSTGHPIREVVKFDLPPMLLLGSTGNDTSLDGIPGGCPIDVQPWCGYTPAIHREQLAVGFLLIVTGFPMGAAMTNSVFSKIIGPFPQGAWMGVLGAGACLARVLCPICVTNIYSAYGPWATFGFMTVVMTIVLVLLLSSYRRLVPYRYDGEDDVIPQRV